MPNNEDTNEEIIVEEIEDEQDDSDDSDDEDDEELDYLGNDDSDDTYANVNNGNDFLNKPSIDSGSYSDTISNGDTINKPSIDGTSSNNNDSYDDVSDDNNHNVDTSDNEEKNDDNNQNNNSQNNNNPNNNQNTSNNDNNQNLNNNNKPNNDQKQNNNTKSENGNNEKSNEPKDNKAIKEGLKDGAKAVANKVAPGVGGKAVDAALNKGAAALDKMKGIAGGKKTNDNNKKVGKSNNPFKNKNNDSANNGGLKDRISNKFNPLKNILNAKGDDSFLKKIKKTFLIFLATNPIVIVIIIIIVVIILIFSVALLSVFGARHEFEIYEIETTKKSSALYCSQVSSVTEIAAKELEDSNSSKIGGAKYKQFMGISMQDAWCAAFVSWVANQAGVSEEEVIKSSAVLSHLNYYKENGTYHEAGSYTPKAGDIILWKGYDPYLKENKSHIGYVEKVEGDIVHTIEGNSDNSVARRQYNMKTDYITGYASPNYSQVSGIAGTLDTGSGTVFDIPQNYKQYYSITCYAADYWVLGSGGKCQNYTPMSRSSHQYEVNQIWKSKGSKFTNGFATIDGRYLIAIAGDMGEAGDYIDVYFDDGSTIPAILGDTKNKGDVNYTKYGHLDGDSLSVVEFEVDPNYYNKYGNPINWAPELVKGKKVKKLVNSKNIATSTAMCTNTDSVISSEALQKFISERKGQCYDKAGYKLRCECVSLIKAYLHEVFGFPIVGRGHAHAYYDNWESSLFNDMRNDFERIPYSNSFKFQPGDIVIWKPYCVAPNEYGHIAIATGNQTNNAFEVFEQNWGKGEQKKARINQHSDQRCLYGVLRPKKSID